MIGDLFYFLYQSVGTLIPAAAALWLAFVVILTIVNTLVSLWIKPDGNKGTGL